MVQDIIAEVGKHGESVVLTSYASFDPSTLSAIECTLKQAGITVLDAITVKQDEGIIKNYISAQEEGLLLGEPGAEKNSENGEKSSIFALKNLNEAENYAKRIEDRKVVYERFSQGEQRGLSEGGRRYVEASLIAGRSVSARETQDGRADRIEAEVERYARDAGIWRDNAEEYLTDLYGNPINSRQESLVFDNGENVVKTSNILQYRDLQDALDGVTLHNTYFPESKNRTWIRNGRRSRIPNHLRTALYYRRQKNGHTTRD